MKTVSLEEFATLPDGIIYSELWEGAPHGLCVKQETCSPSPHSGEKPSDFFYNSMVPEQLGLDGSDDFGIDDVCSRWGMFDYNAKFLIYEAADLKLLRDWICDAK